MSVNELSEEDPSSLWANAVQSVGTGKRTKTEGV
jgi:hypothetical protein